MESENSWNEMCRRKDDDESSSLPVWTPSVGGCEGMSPIPSQEGLDSLEDDTGVPVEEAYRQLYEYVVDDRRYNRHLKTMMNSYFVR